MFTLAQALQWLHGGKLVGDGSQVVERVHTDTRTLQPGDLFVALKGDRFDGNNFLADAQARGAVAAIAHNHQLPAGFAGIEVEDTKHALGAIAAGWRDRFDLPLIAVTGSNGKTTVTQMIASILRAWQPQAVLATQGNLNNDIGLPLQLLRLRAQHAVAVLELGMNHPGEIGYLANLARPSVALVNNAQREHQEFMASVEAVALENGSVFAALGPDGIAVFPAGDEFTPLWVELTRARRHLTFGSHMDKAPDDQADIVLDTAQWRNGRWRVSLGTPAGPIAFDLLIAGRHNLGNSLAAVACALAVGAPPASIVQGLEAFEPVAGRSRTLTLKFDGGHAIVLVDDTYNANPDSMRAAIDVLAQLPGPRLLVLGDMGEVGEQGPRFHAEAGEHARERGIEHLFALGEQSVAMKGRHFDAIGALNSAVLAELPRVSSVLVKGSRFMKMERVVQAITATARQDEDAA